MIILDQANDTSDNDGCYVCDDRPRQVATYEGPESGRRNIGQHAVIHSQQQMTYVTGSLSLGADRTPSPSRQESTSTTSAQAKPGSLVVGYRAEQRNRKHHLDGTNTPDTIVTMYRLLPVLDQECAPVEWRSLPRPAISEFARRNPRQLLLSGPVPLQPELHNRGSSASGFLVENNIFQQVTAPTVYNEATGAVQGYNFAVANT